MKLLKRISSTILMSALVSTVFLGTTAFASMQDRVMPRQVAKDDGTYAKLEASCSTDSISIKITNKTDSKHFCEVIGYLKDSHGNYFADSEALFASGIVSGNQSIADADQRSDVYTIVASGTIYKGTSAVTGSLEHVKVTVGR